MRTNAKDDIPEADIADEIAQYRAILRGRTRYYLAQREAGVPAVSAAILDMVILANLEGCFLDLEGLSRVADMPRQLTRERVMELIRGGWVEVRQSEAGAGLFATDMAASFTDHWIGIAHAA